MIKAIFTALTGIDSSIESPEAQAKWERQRYLDENDLDDDDNFYQDTWDKLPDGAKDYLLDNTTFTDYSSGEQCSTREKRGFLGLW